MPLVEIKDFNALIDNKPIFDQLKTNKKRMKNVMCQKVITIQQEIYWSICIIKIIIDLLV